MKASFQTLLFVFLAALISFGCTINQKKRFDQVQVGMEKDQVLSLMASPQHAERWHGLDRWTYIFYEDELRNEKEIQFSEGKAIYVGDPVKPAVSADERDRKNEEANREVEKQLQSKRQENRQSYENYEGTSTDSQKNPKYVPEYKPIQ
jgi:outer membrane protein assembly factor BamE